MNSSIVTAVIEVSDSIFGIIDDEEWPQEYPPPHTNGLIISMSTGALLATGINIGLVTVRIQVLGESPSILDIGPWDDVVETSFTAPTGQARVAVTMDDVPDDLPLLTPAGPGTYRVRVHASGRDTDPDGVAEEPFETYLIIVWPAPAAPELIHKATDGVGREHRAQGLLAHETPHPGALVWDPDEEQLPQYGPDELD
jgi:hypothetical protein